jgi:DnaJ-class molecular chaperone
MAEVNHYEILGVHRNASPEEIKKAWKTVASILHPDKKNGNTEEFQKAQKAYEVLSDPLKREQYETYGNVADIDTTAKGAITEILMAALSNLSEQNDIKGYIARKLGDHIESCVHGNKMLNKEFDKACSFINRIEPKTHFSVSILEHQKLKILQVIKDNDLKRGIATRALEMLEDMSYDTSTENQQ